MNDHDALKKAEKLFKRRKFRHVLTVLEPSAKRIKAEYNDIKSDCDYTLAMRWFYLLGVSCMYINDNGSATDYLLTARNIAIERKYHVDDALLAQAAIYLRRVNTAKAIELYVDVLSREPKNKTARRALNFLKRPDAETQISRLIENDKIKRFYPPTGFYFPVLPTLLVVLILVLGICAFRIVKSMLPSEKGTRADLEKLGISLNNDERKNPLERDLATQTYNYFLTEKEANDLFLFAADNFQRHRDNAARTMINKLLLSNAAAGIKSKATLLRDELGETNFATVKSSSDNYSFAEVSAEPPLFEGCNVVWSGRVANLEQTDNEIRCLLLVGYSDMKKIDGQIEMRLSKDFAIDSERPLEALGQISFDEGKMFLNVQAIFQSIETAK